MSRSLYRFDWLMFFAIAALLVISCLFIYSADYRSGGHASGSLMGRQMVWALIGLGCYSAVAAMDYRKLSSMHWWIYLAGLISLVLVLFIGMSVYGAHRWFSFGGITVQPSEFAKLASVLTLAAWLGDPATDVERLKTFILAFVLAGVPFLLIAAETDLGSAMVLLPIVMLLLFCAGVPLRPLLTLVGAGVAALLVLIVWLRFFPDSCPFLTDYQKNRILVYLNVNQDPLGAGWNKLQSQIAVGSGGLFGKGYLKGTQNILGFLPRTVAPTDFIYSVVAEESGFAGSALLLGLYTMIVVRCMRAAVVARDTFGRLLAAGVGVLIFSHVFVNIAMTIGLMPITGLPLPLMSYGGTFMVSTMTALGLVQSVYLRRRI
ncbi:MAG: rod shape-determining protein RodA [Kiritimatiellales bacterium]|nr:rod shape-determining protein RodA [Kiritimatiellales bacterium]